MFLSAARIEEEGTTTLLATLTHLGGWPVLLNDNWKEDNYVGTEAVYKIIDQGYPIILPATFHIGIDPENTTKNAIKVSLEKSLNME